MTSFLDLLEPAFLPQRPSAGELRIVKEHPVTRTEPVTDLDSARKMPMETEMGIDIETVVTLISVAVVMPTKIVMDGALSNPERALGTKVQKNLDALAPIAIASVELVNETTKMEFVIGRHEGLITSTEIETVGETAMPLDVTESRELDWRTRGTKMAVKV